MHKAVLKGIISRAFGLLDVAIEAVAHAFSVAEKGGETALDEINRTADKLRELLNKAVDQL